MDLSLYANPEALKNKTGHLAITPLRSWPLSRRSGRFPALLCPPLRSIRILTHETETFVALVITVGVENVVPNICPVAGFEVITLGRFCGDNRGLRLRAMLATHSDLARRLNELEQKYDDQFRVVFEAIRELMAPEPVPPSRRIGFATKPERKSKDDE